MTQTKVLLLADNDLDFLHTRAEILQHTGYKVVQAVSVDEARVKLFSERIHLVILDLRIIDDDDQKDISGLSLAKEPGFRPIPKIILTALPTIQAAREVLGSALDGLPPAVDFLAKREGLDAMLGAVEKAFAQHVRINWDLAIRWSQGGSFLHLLNLIAPETESERLLDRAGELEDLFRKLFFANDQITIGRVLRGGRGQAEAEVFAYGGDELKGQFVVSCGQQEPIQEEKKRYDKWSPRDTDAGSTRLVAHKETMRFGILAYRLIGGDLEEMESLSMYYRHHGSGEVAAVLERLYQTSLAAWHGTDRSYAEDRSLRALYFDWLGLDVDSIQHPLTSKVQAICQEALSNNLLRVQCSSNSLTFHLQADDSLSFSSPDRLFSDNPMPIEQPVLWGITHGWVDTEAVRVDATGRTWLIGFCSVGPGPLLRDFVRLEDAIKTSLSKEMDLLTFYALEQRLLDVDSLLAPIRTEELTPTQAKIANAVAQIRRLAAKETTDSFLQAYLVGLLACALAHITTFDTGIEHYTRRELMPFVRSLLQAAMLYERLTPEPQVRDDLPVQAIKSLWIDEGNQVVWVEGRRIDLTTQEYDILVYLHSRRGELCTRQMIVQEALGEPEEEISQKSRLNSAMSRLRLKVEPNPKHPKYILTVRERGYRLVL